jgi:hypothetical protein
MDGFIYPATEDVIRVTITIESGPSEQAAGGDVRAGRRLLGTPSG